VREPIGLRIRYAGMYLQHQPILYSISKIIEGMPLEEVFMRKKFMCLLEDSQMITQLE
jgi:hypothetical protein